MSIAHRDHGGSIGRLRLVGFCAFALFTFFFAAGCKKQKAGESETPDRQTKGRATRAQNRRSRAVPRKTNSSTALLTRAHVTAWLKKANLDDYRLRGKPKVYDQKNVFDLLNGGAEMYIQTGMRQVGHVSLADRSGARARCGVFLFFMKDQKSAQALLAKEKDKNFKKISLGDEGFRDPEGLLFRKQRVLVKINNLATRNDQKPCPFDALAKQIAADARIRWAPGK